MPVDDELGKRMKTYYEGIPKTKLMRRTPVAIRIDGRAFHTFTRGFAKPFDLVLMSAMNDTMKYLCDNIQGCVFGYTQSDEITLILVDYEKLTTDAWFDYEVQKLCSISASMATMYFNKVFDEKVSEWYKEHHEEIEDEVVITMTTAGAYLKARKTAMFDSRCFNIPKEEVANLIYWRMIDASRNSIQMVGQSCFSHKELQGKSCNDIKQMLLEKRGICWEELLPKYKRGTCYVKTADGWRDDIDVPVTRNELGDLIDPLIFVGV